MVAHRCHPRTCKAEVRGSAQVRSQPDLQSESRGTSEGSTARTCFKIPNQTTGAGKMAHGKNTCQTKHEDWTGARYQILSTHVGVRWAWKPVCNSRIGKTANKDPTSTPTSTSQPDRPATSVRFRFNGKTTPWWISRKLTEEDSHFSPSPASAFVHAQI